MVEKLVNCKPELITDPGYEQPTQVLVRFSLTYPSSPQLGPKNSEPRLQRTRVQQPRHNLSIIGVPRLRDLDFFYFFFVIPSCTPG
jgi:hypothetical protein